MAPPPTRRTFFTGRPTPDDDPATNDPGYISSAVVSFLPKHRDEVLARLQALPGAEARYSSDSKVVVVLEGPGSGALGAMLADISGWPGVLSANMVFEQRLSEET